MALTVTDDVTYLTKPINAVFQSTFLRRAQQVCPYFTGTVPGTINKQQGTSTVKWRRVEQLAASTSALSEITGAFTLMGGRSAATPSITDVLATLSKYGQFYIVNEEVDLYNPNGTTGELIGTLGESAGRSLNQLMATTTEGSLTQVYANNVASKAAVINKVATGDINYVVNKLSRNSARTFTGMTSGALEQTTAPILPAYWGFCHPDVGYDIAQLTGFTSVEKYAQQVSIAVGEIGYYSLAGRGVRFVMSEDALIGLAAGASLGASGLRGISSVDVYAVPIYGQDCLGSVGLGMKHTDGIYKAGDNTGGWEIINHPLGSAGAGDPFNEIATLAYKFFFASAVLNSNWGLSIRCGATLLNP
jgi:N4-gp56 family major capsid protein